MAIPSKSQMIESQSQILTNKCEDEDLTQTELNVLRMIVGNMSDREIAFALDIEQPVFEQIKETIFGKLNVSNHKAAAEKALKLGLVKLEL